MKFGGKAQPVQRKGFTLRTLVSKEACDSIYNMFAVHMHGIQRIARHHGLEEAEVQEIVLGQMCQRMDRAVSRAYQNGRRSAFPPLPPGARRAA